MPQMLSLRKFRLETTTGHVVLFEANTPRFVPDAAVPEAMKAGCVPAESADIPFYDDLSRAKVEFQGDIRKSMLYLAIRVIAERNDPKEFDGGGVPKHEVVSARLGFDVSRQEVLDVFQQYLQAKSEDREFGLHPQAQNILRVIEAETKAELVELAKEFGVEEKQAKGLSVRELRKFLLTKFNGIATG